MPGFWQVLAVHAVRAFCTTEVVPLDLDNTPFHKTGRHVKRAGVFRDEVRSTVRRVVYATGLNLVVVTLRVTPPRGGMPLGLPINVRLHPKHDPLTTVATRLGRLESTSMQEVCIAAYFWGDAEGDVSGFVALAGRQECRRRGDVRRSSY